MNKLVTRQDMSMARALKTIMDRYASGEVLGAIVMYLREYTDDFAPTKAEHVLLIAKEDVLRLELGYE